MKVLCAIDGSEFSNWALEALGTLFHQSLREVVLLNVIDSAPLTKGLNKKGAPQGYIKQAITAMNAEGKKLLKASEQKVEFAISQAVTNPSITIKSVLARGHVAETTVKQTEKRKPDLVIVGSRGLTDIGGYLMGSVSKRVLSHAPAAVLSVKAPVPQKVCALIGVDGSKASQLAAHRVKSWIAPESGSLHVLSVVPDTLTDIAPQILPKARVKALTYPFHLRAQELASQYREFFLKEGYAVSSHVQTGNPREVIVNHIVKKKANLAIMGSKGLTGSERFEMGSVSEWVAAYAPCSVLVVRPRPS